MELITTYRQTDADHNAWTCENCGHIACFEADGPYENGWNFCPSCGITLNQDADDPVRGSDW